MSSMARIRTCARRLLAVGGLFVSAMATAAGCPPAGHDLASLQALKAANFEVPNDAGRQSLARALLACLADPDPARRDGIAFEAYSTWLRAGKLEVATRTDLLSGLVAMLQPDSRDKDGFRQPFAALVLSEVARTDRLSEWMSAEQRNRLVSEAARYLESVRDYRGFVEKEGWRHGVAHGSDLVLQLVLNPRLDRVAVDRLLTAVAAQVAPAGEHAYVDGESERLARPVLYAASRKLHSTEDWRSGCRPCHRLRRLRTGARLSRAGRDSRSATTCRPSCTRCTSMRRKAAMRGCRRCCPHCRPCSRPCDAV